MSKLTPSMRQVLANLHAGLRPSHGLTGRSTPGRLHWTFVNLRRSGFVDLDHKITPAGREALKGSVDA